MSAELNYWSFPQYLVDGLGGDAPRSPIIAMVSTAKQMTVDVGAGK